MSQSKVDQRKYEKKHRKEILRKQKVKKVLAVTITIVVIAGVKIYKAIPKYVEASSLNSYIDKAYSDLGYDSLLPATGTDASEEDTTDSEEAADSTSEEDTTEAASSEETASTEEE